MGRRGRVRGIGRRDVSVDATGFESRHISRHFLHRSGRMKQYRPFVKFSACVDHARHLILGLHGMRGPSNDASAFEPVVRQASRHVTIDRLMADAAYDAESLHVLCRDTLGIGDTLIPINDRGHPDAVPKTKYRREMFERLPQQDFNQRWHCESAFSQIKRRLGAALTARSHPGRLREISWLAITHNLMILAP